MSHRPAALSLVAVLCLVATAFSAPLLAGAAAGFGEHNFASNPIAGAGDPFYPVYRNSTLAQSFYVDKTFLIKSVTLRVQNDGSSVNPLRVSIRTDDATYHVPVMSQSLANSSQVTPNNAAGPENWTFPFNPAAQLTAGSVYWIVAENGAPQPPPLNGYAWVESNGNTYAAGSAYLLDPTTGVWTGLPYDLFFSTYGLEYAANLTLDVTANRTQAQPGDSVTFTVHMNNTGSRAAPMVWVNESLAPGLTDPVPAFPDILPDSGAAFPNLIFRNVTNGPHYFTVTAQVAVGTAPGTTLTNTAVLAFELASGTVVRRGPSSAGVVVGIVRKQLYLAGTSVATKLLTTSSPTLTTPTGSSLNAGSATPLTFLQGPALARPFLALDASASLWISIVKAPPQTLKLNLSLLDGPTVLASLYPSILVTAPGYQLMTFKFPTLNDTLGTGDRLELQIWSYGGAGGSTDTLKLAYNSTGDASRLDLTTTTYVSVDSLVLGNQAGPTSAWSPRDSLVAWANVSDPFGASRISGSWITITSPSNQIVVSGAMAVLGTDPSAIPAWKLFGYTLGGPLALGTYRVEVGAVEDNGVTALAESPAKVTLPSFSLSDVANVSRAHVGDAFAYFLYFNNSGTGPAATVWLNDTLPAELTFVGSSLAYSSLSGSTYGWILTNVAVGGHRLEIDVSVPGSSMTAKWVTNRATLVYADTSGNLQPALASNTTVFLNGPQLGLTLTSLPSGRIHSNESATFTIVLHNVGDAAAYVWLNDTLPAAFIYLSDTAANFGGTSSLSGSEVRMTLPGMPAGATWTLQLAARAGPALVRNASYANLVTVDYTSVTGYLMPRDTAFVSLATAAPWMDSGAIVFLSPKAGPGNAVRAEVQLANAGNESASAAWLNLTADMQLVLVNASRAYVRNGNDVLFVLGAMPVGQAVVFLNFTVADTALDGAVLRVLGTLDYQDGIGNSLPTLLLTTGSVAISSAVLDLIVNPPAPYMEAGMAFPLGVYVNNVGTGPTGDIWLNLTLPTILTYFSDTSGITPNVVGNAYSWHWMNQASGSFAFVLWVRPREATPNGTAADLPFLLGYHDFDGTPSPAVNATVHAVVIAPSLRVTVSADRTEAVPGSEVVYALRIQNLGMTLAERVEATANIDPRLQLVSYSSSVAATGSQSLTWNFTDLAPGSTQTINLTVRLADGLQAGVAIPMALEVNYTNSAGITLANIRSSPVIITIQADWQPLIWLALGGLAAAGLLALAAYRRKRVDIEEVFLVYRDGVLISHLSRTLMREKDEDVLSGMLTAVQEFVREAFQYGEHRELHQLDFGEYRILIERGKYVYLAVVYSGLESRQIRKKVRAVIDRIESQFGTALEKWDGDMEEVVGARDLIRDTLLGSGNRTLNHNHEHAPKPPLAGA